MVSYITKEIQATLEITFHIYKHFHKEIILLKLCFCGLH